MVFTKKTNIWLHEDFYIPEMKNLAFYLPHVRIIGTNNCGNTLHEAFKFCTANKYVFFCPDYSDRVVDNFSYQIQSE